MKPPNKPMQLTALSFQLKKVIGFVKLVTIGHRSASRIWRAVTPQLMGRAVRKHHCGRAHL
jgi:hypothetical protein